ncbi:MAG: DUF1559 family PulG-like putative transporter, partial [Planctomycetota bacterium]
MHTRKGFTLTDLMACLLSLCLFGFAISAALVGCGENGKKQSDSDKKARAKSRRRAGARELARRVQCATNLYAISRALVIYRADFADWFPWLQQCDNEPKAAKA